MGMRYTWPMRVYIAGGYGTLLAVFQLTRKPGAMTEFTSVKYTLLRILWFRGLWSLMIHWAVKEVVKFPPGSGCIRWLRVHFGILWNDATSNRALLRLLAVTSGATDDDVALQGARSRARLGVAKVFWLRNHELSNIECQDTFIEFYRYQNIIKYHNMIILVLYRSYMCCCLCLIRCCSPETQLAKLGHRLQQKRASPRQSERIWFDSLSKIAGKGSQTLEASHLDQRLLEFSEPSPATDDPRWSSSSLHPYGSAQTILDSCLDLWISCWANSIFSRISICSSMGSELQRVQVVQEDLEFPEGSAAWQQDELPTPVPGLPMFPLVGESWRPGFLKRGDPLFCWDFNLVIVIWSTQLMGQWCHDHSNHRFKHPIQSSRRFGFDHELWAFQLQVHQRVVLRRQQLVVELGRSRSAGCTAGGWARRQYLATDLGFLIFRNQKILLCKHVYRLDNELLVHLYFHWLNSFRSIPNSLHVHQANSNAKT